MVARTTMQFSTEHLFPLEQIAVGGRYSVRGYQEFTFVRDNGFLASLEFRVPVFTTADGVDRLHLAPFADVGRSWNTGPMIAIPVARVIPLTDHAGQRRHRSHRHHHATEPFEIIGGNS
jgi:outer membrane protein assembly factor BamA